MYFETNSVAVSQSLLNREARFDLKFENSLIYHNHYKGLPYGNRRHARETSPTVWVEFLNERNHAIEMKFPFDGFNTNFV